jgi:hypothetical protein
MPTSSIPTFKAAFVARLKADTSLGAAVPAVQVSYGLPAMGQRGLLRELVIVGDSRADDLSHASSPYGGGGQHAATLGALQRQEDYIVEVFIRVIGPGTDGQQACTERAFAITAAIENSLRVWSTNAGGPWSGITISGGQFFWAQVANTNHSEGINQSGDHECLVEMAVTCSARI